MVQGVGIAEVQQERSDEDDATPTRAEKTLAAGVEEVKRRSIFFQRFLNINMFFYVENTFVVTLVFINMEVIQHVQHFSLKYFV